MSYLFSTATLLVSVSLVQIAFPQCPSQCNAPNCRPITTDSTYMEAWVYGQCTGYCQTNVADSTQNYCSTPQDWGTSWTSTDCTGCPGYPTPECVDECRLCPAASLNQSLFANGICTGICYPIDTAPEYEYGFCLDLYFQGENGTLDCSQCNISSVTTQIVYNASNTPSICIDSGMTSFGGYGWNIQHCKYSINDDHCDVYQELNGDSIINPSGTCRGFCNYFGLDCVAGWSDAENGCNDYDGWNSDAPGTVGCDTIGDPPDYTDRFTPDHICSCAAYTSTTTSSSTSTTTSTPMNTDSSTTQTTSTTVTSTTTQLTTSSSFTDTSSSTMFTSQTGSSSSSTSTTETNETTASEETTSSNVTFMGCNQSCKLCDDGSCAATDENCDYLPCPGNGANMMDLVMSVIIVWIISIGMFL